jgi:DNA-binding response OmpR family regulator
LLADDDPTCLSSLSDFFTDEGFDVVAVRDGSLALERLESEPFSLLITDLNMPGATGSDLLAFVKKAGLSLPVIIITASSDDDAREQARVMGAADYVSKPIGLDDLLVRVVKHLA